MVKGANIAQYYASSLGPLFLKAQEGGLTMEGMPHGLYFNYPQDENTQVDLGAAIPVSEAASISGATAYNLPARQAITLDFYGNYDKLGVGHEAILEYMDDRGYGIDFPITEEYANDPTTVDESKIHTKIAYYFTAKN